MTRSEPSGLSVDYLPYMLYTSPYNPLLTVETIYLICFHFEVGFQYIIPHRWFLGSMVTYLNTILVNRCNNVHSKGS